MGVPVALEHQNGLGQAAEVLLRGVCQDLLKVPRPEVPQNVGVLGVLLRHAGEGGELLPQGLNQRRGGGALLRGHGRQRGLVLLQDQGVQSAGGARPEDEPGEGAALRVDAGGQHAAHAVPQEIDPVRADQGLCPQQGGGAQGVPDDLLLHAEAALKGVGQPLPVGKGALVVAEAGHPEVGQPDGQIPEGAVWTHGLVPVLRAGTVDQQDGGKGARAVGEGEQAGEGIIRVGGHSDGKGAHETASFHIGRRCAYASPAMRTAVP